MFENPETAARIGRTAWVMAWVALVVGQLHALARFATEEGKSDLDAGIVRAWAEPAASALSPLLGWASADAVYLTYGKIWFPVLLATTLAAFLVHHRRRSLGFRGAEKWAWRVALTAYVLATIGCFAEYWLQWGEGNQALLDGVFLALLPVLLLTMLSTTFLGIVLVRRGLGLPAWLLALVIPGLFAISTVTSLGNVFLPIAFAFGILGRRLASTPAPAGRVPEDAPQRVVGHTTERQTA